MVRAAAVLAIGGALAALWVLVVGRWAARYAAGEKAAQRAPRAQHPQG